MLKELNEFKDLLKKIEDTKKEMEEFLVRTVSVQKIICYRIPKSHKAIAKRIMKALNLDECLWIRLSICDSTLDSTNVFGRKEEILSQIQAISKMMVLRRKMIIGNIGIGWDPNTFGLDNFIYF
ncbi:hypothetical protein D4R86_01615 [bacterium]|nr:MAG: hypothetical protein D4R86_01615 [bacterium]